MFKLAADALFMVRCSELEASKSPPLPNLPVVNVGSVPVSVYPLGPLSVPSDSSLQYPCKLASSDRTVVSISTADRPSQAVVVLDVDVELLVELEVDVEVEVVVVVEVDVVVVVVVSNSERPQYISCISVSVKALSNIKASSISPSKNCAGLSEAPLFSAPTVKSASVSVEEPLAVTSFNFNPFLNTANVSAVASYLPTTKYHVPVVTELAADATEAFVVSPVRPKPISSVSPILNQ
jgi:hypothetical protein